MLSAPHANEIQTCGQQRFVAHESGRMISTYIDLFNLFDFPVPLLRLLLFVIYVSTVCAYLETEAVATTNKEYDKWTERSLFNLKYFLWLIGFH